MKTENNIKNVLVVFTKKQLDGIDPVVIANMKLNGDTFIETRNAYIKKIHHGDRQGFYATVDIDGDIVHRWVFASNQTSQYLMGITKLEEMVLNNICQQLSDWRDSEPGYSCIDGSDVTRELDLKPKTVSGVIGSLCKKGFIISETGDFDGIIYPNWDKIPHSFGR